MSATIYHMPPRGEVNQQKEREGMNQKEGETMTDRYDGMTRAELRAECEARGIKWAPIERVALVADRSEYTRRTRGGIGGAALREALREYDHYKAALREYDRYNRDITDDIQSVITHLTDLLALPLEAHDHLARPALARKACELALDLLSDHT